MRYIVAMMNFLKTALVAIPEQVVSTLIIWGFLFMVYRGAISVFNDPPSTTVILSVVGLGVVFGLFTSLNTNDPEYD